MGTRIRVGNSALRITLGFPDLSRELGAEIRDTRLRGARVER
jgi:hypothetical protein